MKDAAGLTAWFELMHRRRIANGGRLFVTRLGERCLSATRPLSSGFTLVSVPLVEALMHSHDSSVVLGRSPKR